MFLYKTGLIDIFFNLYFALEEKNTAIFESQEV